MLIFLFVATILLGSTRAFTHKDANEYIERVLNGRFVDEAKYNRLDPYRLDRVDTKLNFTWRPSGQATLSKASIINLSKVRRAQDCTIPVWKFANISFSCFLQFDHLRVNYTANVSYDNIEVLFYPHVAIKGTNVTVQITTTDAEDVPNLRLFFVNHIGGMNVTADMISIGDSAQVVGPAIREVIVKHATKSLHEALNGRFRNALAYSIYKTPFGFPSK